MSNAHIRALHHLASELTEGTVSFSDADRFACSRDLWPKHLIRLHEGLPSTLPLAVIQPQTTEEVQHIVVRCRQARIPLVPYGAGSSVVGGATVEEGQVVIDFKRMNAPVRVDSDSMVVWSQVGVMGELLERQVNRSGFTQGHFPSSIYCTSIGGWIAARSAGQMSSRFGKIEDQVVGGTVVLGDGRIVKQSILPGRFGELADLVGAEGTLGLWTEAAMRIHRLPETRAWRGFNFPDLQTAIDATREWLEAGISPSVIRIYDPLDTFLHKDAHGTQEAKDRGPSKLAWAGAAFPRVLNTLGNTIAAECRCILGLEGSGPIVALELARVMNIAKEHGAEDLGEEAGEHWYERRYAISYKQSNAMRAGVLPDTMEIGCTWENIIPTYNAVRKAALECGASILAHFSHLYLDGGSIYFTFAMPVTIGEEGYLKLWDKTLGAAVSAGANVSHHHGIGKLKAPVLNKVWGGTRKIYNEVRRGIDPDGILNPKVLVPVDSQAHRAKQVFPTRVLAPVEMEAVKPSTVVRDVETALQKRGRSLGDSASFFGNLSVLAACQRNGFWRVDPQLRIMEPILLGVDGAVKGEKHAYVPAPRGAQGAELTGFLLEHEVDRIWVRTELPYGEFVGYLLNHEDATALARTIVQDNSLRNCRVRLLPGHSGRNDWEVRIDVHDDSRAELYLKKIRGLAGNFGERREAYKPAELSPEAAFIRSNWETAHRWALLAQTHKLKLILPWVDPIGVAGFLDASRISKKAQAAIKGLQNELMKVAVLRPRAPAAIDTDIDVITESIGPSIESSLPKMGQYEGALDNCTYCPKLCRFSCPAAVAEGSEAIIPRQLLLSVNLHRKRTRDLNSSTAAKLWSCLDCGACTEYCDHGNPVTEIIQEARRDLVASGEAPASIRQTLDEFIEGGSFADRYPSDAPGIELDGDGASSETWIFLGCQGGSQNEKHNRAALELARKFFGNVHVMTGPMTCCGGVLDRWGDEDAFRKHARAFAHQVAGVSRLVIDDGGCGVTMRERYRKVGARLPPIVSTTELLAELDWELPQGKNWVPHDCCDHPKRESTLRHSLRGGEDLAKGSVMEGTGGSCGGLLAHYRDVENGVRLARSCRDDLLGGGGERILVESPTCRAQFERARIEVDDLLEVWLEAEKLEI